MWPLLRWDVFLLYTIGWGGLLGKHFGKCSSYIYWGDHVTFIFHSIDMKYHTYWFAYVEPSLHSRDKTNLSLCIILLMCSWIWLTIILCICIHQGYWSIVFFPCTILIWLWYQSNAGLVEWVWRYSLLFNCSEVFKKNWHLYFKCLVEFTSEAIHFWNFLCWAV